MKNRLRLANWRMPIIFVCMVVILSVVSSGIFLKTNNIINLFAQNSIIGVIAIGQLLIIVSGGIDLSVGSMMAFCSLMYVAFQEMGMLFSIILAVVTGVVLGAVNGFMVTKLKILPFITTLTTMGIFRGLALIIVNGRVIYDIKDEFLSLNEVKILGIPLLVYIWLFLGVLGIILLKFTSFSVKLYSTGGNERASGLSGLRTNRIKMLVYILSGVLCGVSGVLYTGRLALADPNYGSTYALDSITAVVIGGAALSGGEGKLSNVILSVLILGMLNNFMIIVGIPSAMHVGIKGLILVITVYLNNTELFSKLHKRRNAEKLLNRHFQQ